MSINLLETIFDIWRRVQPSRHLVRIVRDRAMDPQRADYLLLQRALVPRPIQSKVQSRVEHGWRIDPRWHAGDQFKSIGTGSVAVDIVAGDAGELAGGEEPRIVEQRF